MLKTNLH
jgi:hypothetical protein